MTQEQIEGDKVIAKFMGSVVTIEDHTKGNEDYCKEQGIEKWLIQTWSKPDGFNDAWGWGKYKLGKWEYHSSWDWLMPVVNKFINETIRPTEARDANEYRDYCNRLHNLVTDYKTMPVFNCLVTAIKWYNQNK